MEQNAFDLGVPQERLPTQLPREVDWIEEMVGALFDPLIVWPSPWQDTIPENLKKELPLRPPHAVQ